MKKPGLLNYFIMIIKTKKSLMYVYAAEIFFGVSATLVPIGLVGILLKMYEEHQSFEKILLTCIIVTSYNIIVNILMYRHNITVERINRHFKHLFLKKVYQKLDEIDFATHQSNEFLDNYNRLIEEGPVYAINYFYLIVDASVHIINFLLIGTLLTLISPIILIYTLFIAIISILISKTSSNCYRLNEEANKGLNRKRLYYRRVFYLKDSAIDLKTTNLSKIINCF